MPSSRDSSRTLLVGNLTTKALAEAVESDLKRTFGKFDTVAECEVLRDEAGISRGFAFVRLREARNAERAKAELDGTRFAGSAAVKVRWALSTATLFVGDLAPTVTADVLREAFRQFGNVIDCRIESEPPELGGASKLYGFVEYSKRAVAAKVRSTGRRAPPHRPHRAPPACARSLSLPLLACLVPHPHPHAGAAAALGQPLHHRQLASACARRVCCRERRRPRGRAGAALFTMAYIIMYIITHDTT